MVVMLGLILAQILCAAVITAMTAMGVWAPIAFITHKPGRYKGGGCPSGRSANSSGDRLSNEGGGVDASSRSHHTLERSAFGTKAPPMPHSSLKARQMHTGSGYHLVSSYPSAIMSGAASSASISVEDISLHHQRLLSLINSFSAAMLVTIATTRFMPEALGNAYPSHVDRIATFVLIGIVVPAVIECAVSDAHGHSHGMAHHHHDHFDSSDTSNTHAAATPSITTTTLLVLLMCFHSMMEGMLLGLESSTRALLAIMIPLSLHKLIDGVVVGVSIAKQYQRDIERWMEECQSLQNSHDMHSPGRHSHNLSGRAAEQTETLQPRTYDSTEYHHGETGPAASSSNFSLTDNKNSSSNISAIHNNKNIHRDPAESGADGPNYHAVAYMLPISQQQFKEQQKQQQAVEDDIALSLPLPPPSPHDELWCVSVILWLLMTPTAMILSMLYYNYSAGRVHGNESAKTNAKGNNTGGDTPQGALKSLVTVVHAVGAGSFLYIGLSLMLHEEQKGIRNALAFLVGVAFTLIITYTNVIMT